MKLNLLFCAAALVFMGCNFSNKTNTGEAKVGIKNEKTSYSLDSVNMNGYIAYDSGSQTKRPIILIIHEWWGQNDYVRNRANQLADLGYLAMAVDLYGNGLTADNPEKAGELAGPFYQNPQMAKDRFDAALTLINKHPLADTNNIAAIGYCFGGGMVLNIARLGENLKGVVSFHGSLVGVPANKATLKAKILICHGDGDEFVKPDEVAKFKTEMERIGVPYLFKEYPGATHAFTNPDATTMGQKFHLPIAYNAQADANSWGEMKLFLANIFK